MALLTNEVYLWLKETGWQTGFKTQNKSRADARQQNTGFEMWFVKRAWKNGYISRKNKKNVTKKAPLPKMSFQVISVCIITVESIYTNDILQPFSGLHFQNALEPLDPLSSLSTLAQGLCFASLWVRSTLGAVRFISTNEKMGHCNIFLQNKNPFPLKICNCTYPVIW